MKIKLLYLVLISGFLTACASLVPQTPEEFTQSAVVEVDINEVHQNYSKVVDLIKSKSEECLNKKLVRRTCTNGNCMDDNVTYTSTMLEGQKKSRLYVQMGVPRYTTEIRLVRQPEGGKILAVAEIAPIGTNRTKVEIYGMKYGWHAIPKSIKHWVNSTNSGCPNLSKDDH